LSKDDSNNPVEEIGECPDISLEEALDIIKEYDLDGDERLNFDEF
jgi:hypothetical protein